MFTQEQRNLGWANNSIKRKQKTHALIQSGLWNGKNLITLRMYLIDNNGYRCSECKLDYWNGQKITLEVHHIDGNRNNNNLKNVILLCPNCHSQTDTFKNKKRS